MITTGSHFSGYGSYLLALKRLQVKHKSLFACDFDKFVKQTYLANHNTDNFYHDVSDTNWEDAPYVDLFVTSPPCQAFSFAGLMKGIDDPRGILFTHSHKYIYHKRPRFVVIENVPGLVSKKFKSVFDSWLKMLAVEVNGCGIQYGLFEERFAQNCGYYVKWTTLNAKDFGIPQSRNRVFIVAFRDKEDYDNFQFPKPFPLQKRVADLLEDEVDEKYYMNELHFKWIEKVQIKKNKKFKDLTKEEYCNTLSSSYGKKYFLSHQDFFGIVQRPHGSNKGHFFTNGIAPLIHGNDYTGNNPILVKQLNPSKESNGNQPYQHNRVYCADGCSPALTATLNGREKFALKAVRSENAKKERRENIKNGLGDTNKFNDKSLVPTELIPTITSQVRKESFVLDNVKIRRLTPKECSRLMGCDDDFIQPCSDSQAYKQYGNSIVVDVLYYLFKNLLSPRF